MRRKRYRKQRQHTRSYRSGRSTLVNKGVRYYTYKNRVIISVPKNMTTKQFNNLDIDLDGVITRKDCRPFNPKKQDEEEVKEPEIVDEPKLLGFFDSKDSEKFDEKSKQDQEEDRNLDDVRRELKGFKEELGGSLKDLRADQTIHQNREYIREAIDNQVKAAQTKWNVKSLFDDLVAMGQKEEAAKEGLEMKNLIRTSREKMFDKWDSMRPQRIIAQKSPEDLKRESERMELEKKQSKLREQELNKSMKWIDHQIKKDAIGRQVAQEFIGGMIQRLNERRRIGKLRKDEFRQAMKAIGRAEEAEVEALRDSLRRGEVSRSDARNAKDMILRTAKKQRILLGGPALSKIARIAEGG